MKYQLFEILLDNDIEMCDEYAGYAYSKVKLEGLGTNQLQFTERKDKTLVKLTLQYDDLHSLALMVTIGSAIRNMLPELPDNVVIIEVE